MEQSTVEGVDMPTGEQIQASSSPPRPSSEKTPLLKASPVSNIPAAAIHPARNIDPLDAARNRLDNPYQDSVSPALNSTSVRSNRSVSVQSRSASARYGSTIWRESQIDDKVLPPIRTLKKGATTNLQTLMHIFKGNVGTGILALPYAYSNGGIWFGLVGTTIVATIALHNMHLLVEASHHLCHLMGKETLDYGFCMDFAFKNVQGGGPKTKKMGRWMRKLVNLSLQITQFGFCCVYFVFMAESIAHVVNNNAGLDLSSRVYMSMILPFVLALSCIRSIKQLSYFSTVANFLCISGLIMVFVQLFRDMPSIESVPAIEPDYTKWPIFLATTIYAFEGIGIMLPLENKMKNPQAFLPWNGVLNTAMFIVSCLYIAMGFFGYLKFGKDCLGSITLNLPPNLWINDVVRVMFAVAIFISYALQLYVPVEIIWPILRKRVKKEAWKKSLERLFRCFLVLCTFAIAMAIPHLGPFISLIGAFASSSLALLFPVLIDTLVRWPSRLGCCHWRLIKNFSIFIFGLVGFFFGTWQSVNEIIIAFQKDANSTVAPPTDIPITPNSSHSMQWPLPSLNP